MVDILNRFLKTCWYYFMKGYIGMGLLFFFKKIKISGVENIPKEAAVILTANHQNAFMDALLVTMAVEGKVNYLVRADVFKNPVARWFLGSLNMMPIYRIRDGWKALSNNDSIFQSCYRMLGNREKLLIFPEGNHHIRRRLRPLSKGFTRLVLGTHEQYPNLPMYIVPIGINYSNHAYFREKVHVVVGKPIAAAPYLAAERVNDMRQDLSEALKKLMVHIEDAEKYNAIEKRLLEQPELLLQPSEANQLIEELEASVLEEGEPVLARRRESKLLKGIATLFWLPWLPLLWLWKGLERKIADRAFWASIKFALGVFVFAPYTLMLSYALSHFHSTMPMAVFCAYLTLFSISFLMGGELHRRGAS